MSASTIPVVLLLELLPDPALSVSAFLQFHLPTQLADSQHAKNQAHGAEPFGQKLQPDPLNEALISIIRCLPIPAPSLLARLLTFDGRAAWLSVRYAHLPSSNEDAQHNFPPWIIEYWQEVSRLQAAVRRPWIMAEIYLIRTQQSWKTPRTREIGDAATLPLLQLPWAGKTS